MSQIYKTPVRVLLQYLSAMKNLFFNLTFVLICFGLFLNSSFAQEKAKFAMPETYPPAQLAAMKKLDFLVGKWRGKGWVMTYTGKRENFTIDETVESRVGGLVLVVEGLGKSKDAEMGRETITHNALGILSFEPQTGIYRWRAHTFYGNSLETVAEIGDKSFIWGFKHPQAGDTRYTVTINNKGNWLEIGESSRDGGKTWTKFLEMELEKAK